MNSIQRVLLSTAPGTVNTPRHQLELECRRGIPILCLPAGGTLVSVEVENSRVPRLAPVWISLESVVVHEGVTVVPVVCLSVIGGASSKATQRKKR